MRKASSLLVARRVHDITKNNLFDYKILFLKRASKMQWANMLAYPGGVIEDNDLKYIKSNPSKFQFPSEDRDLLAYHIFKMAALRETFEETGLFFLAENMLRTETHDTVKDILRSSLERNQLPNFFDVARILNMAYKDNVVEFLRLVTVPQAPVRYNCQFFLCVASPENTLNLYKGMEDTKYLHDLDNLSIHEAESSDYTWLNPCELLKMYMENKVKLAPPQFIMANIMLSFEKIDDLMKSLKRVKAEGEDNAEKKDAFEKNPLTFPLMIGMARHKQEKFLAQDFKFAGLFPSDRDYPLDMYLKLEKDEDWKREMTEKYGELNEESRGVCRLYFKDMKQMFENDFDFDIAMKTDFPFQRMLGKDAMKARLAELSIYENFGA